MNSDVLQQVNDYKIQLQEQKSLPELLETIIQLRKMTSKETDTPLQEIVQTDICKLLVAIMDNTTSSEVIMESLWILTNVCSGNYLQTKYIVDIGGVPSFLKYVSHENEDIMAQALWGLGNIAGDSAVNRDLILEQGAVAVVLKQLERKNIKLANQRTIVWVISNFCRGKPQPKYDVVRPCIFYLGKAIENYQGDQEIISDSLWGINYLSETEVAIEDLINYGIMQKICNNYMTSELHNILTPAVRIIGNIATSKDSYVDILLQQNVLTPLVNLFVHAKKGYRKESLWTISNIMAGTPAQVKKVLSHPNFYENLISNKNQTLDIRKEMYFVISNGLRVPYACQFFLDKGVLPFFFEDIQFNDLKLQTVILEGLELLITYMINNLKDIPELSGKLKYMKEIILPKINSDNIYKYKTLLKSLKKFIQHKSSPVDLINSGLDNLKLQDNQNAQQNSEGSYETIDDEDEDESQMDQEEDDEEDDDDGDDDDEDAIDIEVNTNVLVQEKSIITNNNLSKPANAQNNQPFKFGEGDPDAQTNLVESHQIIEEYPASAAAAPPAYIDYQSFYFNDDQTGASAGAAAAPGP